jgi:two-component system, OmpR family, sensor histidine kinase ChvG
VFDGAVLDARVGNTRAERVVLEAVRPVGPASGAALALLVEEDSERVLSLTDRAASKLFISSFVVSLSAAALLLGFAGWLSWRIRRLSRAAGDALGADSGRVPVLPEDQAGDELGELSRNFSGLLVQIGEYNDYLRSLGSRITHELRTPMTVVRTSLENLQAEAGDHVYLERARQGIERLQAMVAALGAATRMEQAISSAETERFDLARLLAELGAALQAAHPQRDLRLVVPTTHCAMDGAPELIAQMVDKLVENAMDFCPREGVIRLALSADGDEWLLEVSNTGSQLPAGPPERLFDSMVSSPVGGRPDKRSDDPLEDRSRPHLGLGLYIVRLVARHHGGRVSAGNLPDNTGVCFGVHLPVAKAERPIAPGPS